MSVCRQFYQTLTGPFGRNVPLVAAIKRAVNEAGFKTPVVADRRYYNL